MIESVTMVILQREYYVSSVAIIDQRDNDIHVMRHDTLVIGNSSQRPIDWSRSQILAWGLYWARDA
jgi:hypothetical protein